MIASSSYAIAAEALWEPNHLAPYEKLFAQGLGLTLEFKT